MCTPAARWRGAPSGPGMQAARLMRAACIPGPSTHPRLWAGMLRVRTRTAPLYRLDGESVGYPARAGLRPFLAGPGAPAAHATPGFRGCGTPAQALAVPCGFPPGEPTGVVPPVEPSAGRRPPETGGGVRRFALPTGRGYAPHQNRAAGASLKASPRLAPGRWTRPPLRGRWQAFFRRLPPSAIADPSTPRARGAKGPRHVRCGAWSLAPTREAGGPRPHARPIAALSRANRPPAWGGCAPTRLPFGKGWAPGRSAPPKVQRAPRARAALGGSPMLRVRSHENPAASAAQAAWQMIWRCR